MHGRVLFRVQLSHGRGTVAVVVVRAADAVGVDAVVLVFIVVVDVFVVAGVLVVVFVPAVGVVVVELVATEVVVGVVVVLVRVVDVVGGSGVGGAVVLDVVMVRGVDDVDERVVAALHVVRAACLVKLRQICRGRYVRGFEKRRRDSRERAIK